MKGGAVKSRRGPDPWEDGRDYADRLAEEDADYFARWGLDDLPPERPTYQFREPEHGAPAVTTPRKLIAPAGLYWPLPWLEEP